MNSNLNLTKGQKRKLTNLANNEANRLEDVFFGGVFMRNGGTDYADSRAYRLRRARQTRNYSRMLHFIPKRKLRQAGFAV